MQPVKVKILDREYLVKSDESLDQVYEIAEYVNEKLLEIKAGSEGLSDTKTAILAALNIASEYFQMKREREETLVRIRRRTEDMIDNINSAIR